MKRELNLLLYHIVFLDLARAHNKKLPNRLTLSIPHALSVSLIGERVCEKERVASPSKCALQCSTLVQFGHNGASAFTWFRFNKKAKENVRTRIKVQTTNSRLHSSPVFSPRFIDGKVLLLQLVFDPPDQFESVRHTTTWHRTAVSKRESIIDQRAMANGQTPKNA